MTPYRGQHEIIEGTLHVRRTLKPHGPSLWANLLINRLAEGSNLPDSAYYKEALVFITAHPLTPEGREQVYRLRGKVITAVKADADGKRVRVSGLLRRNGVESGLGSFTRAHIEYLDGEA